MYAVADVKQDDIINPDEEYAQEVAEENDQQNEISLHDEVILLVLAPFHPMLKKHVLKLSLI